MLKKAHTTDNTIITMNWRHGKNTEPGIPKISVYCNTNVYAIVMPIATPIRQLVSTSTIAS